MQRFGYEISQLDRNVWMIWKNDDFGGTCIPISEQEKDLLLMAARISDKSFVELLEEIRKRPLTGIAAKQAKIEAVLRG